MVQKIKERLILLLESGYVTLRNSEHDICVANIDLANAGELKSSDLKAYIESYLNEDRREKGKHLPRAAEGVNLGFSQEGSGCVIYIPSMKKTIVTNHVRFNES